MVIAVFFPSIITERLTTNAPQYTTMESFGALRLTVTLMTENGEIVCTGEFLIGKRMPVTDTISEHLYSSSCDLLPKAKKSMFIFM